jgi:hypothetical protein
MKVAKIKAVEMVRKIRDKQARSLAHKSPAEVLAFFRAAGEAAMDAARRRASTQHRKAS